MKHPKTWLIPRPTWLTMDVFFPKKNLASADNTLGSRVVRGPLGVFSKSQLDQPGICNEKR